MTQKEVDRLKKKLIGLIKKAKNLSLLRPGGAVDRW